MENIFDAKVAQNYIDRINQLTPETQRTWGTMSVDQMLAHCNVAYETIYEPQRHQKPKPFTALLLKWFVKPGVVSEKAYRQVFPQHRCSSLDLGKILKTKKRG